MPYDWHQSGHWLGNGLTCLMEVKLLIDIHQGRSLGRTWECSPDVPSCPGLQYILQWSALVHKWWRSLCNICLQHAFCWSGLATLFLGYWSHCRYESWLRGNDLGYYLSSQIFCRRLAPLQVISMEKTSVQLYCKGFWVRLVAYNRIPDEQNCKLWICV